MKITVVGPSERQYFVKGNFTAYITLNSASGFNVYVNKGRMHFMKSYKTLKGAQKYLTSEGFVERT